ncbi:HAD-IIA family hydrolase [Angustibacter aerolatus]
MSVDGAPPPASFPGSDGPLLAHHDVLLLDLDGVVYVGGHAVEGAQAALDAARSRGARLAFVTNNAARTPETVAAHLERLGVQAAPSDVVTSAQAAASVLAAQLPAGAPVLAVGGEGLVQALRAVGLQPVAPPSAEASPQERAAAEAVLAVAQGFTPALDWSMLVEACAAVRRGIPWVASNTDLSIPTERGVAPGNGAFVEVVARTTGRQPQQVAGKPFPPLMRESVERTGGRSPLVVGDRLDTDVAGAVGVGLPSLLVLTGVTDLAGLLAAGADERPTFLGDDLSALHRPHAAVVAGGGGWQCGEARVREVDGELVVDERGGDRLELAQAVASAVWALGDARPARRPALVEAGRRLLDTAGS